MRRKRPGSSGSGRRRWPGRSRRSLARWTGWRRSRWPEAREAVRRAEAAVAVGEADPATADRVHQRLRNSSSSTGWSESGWRGQRRVKGFPRAGADRDYARAFREYGVDVDECRSRLDRPTQGPPGTRGRLGTGAGRLGSPPARIPRQDVGRWTRLVAITHGIDPEPLRDRIRAAWGQPVANVPDDLLRLAESIDVRTQHTATLGMLTRALRQVQQSDSALRILRDASDRPPGGFLAQLRAGLCALRAKGPRRRGSVLHRGSSQPTEFGGRPQQPRQRPVRPKESRCQFRRKVGVSSRSMSFMRKDELPPTFPPCEWRGTGQVGDDGQRERGRPRGKVGVRSVKIGVRS